MQTATHPAPKTVPPALMPVRIIEPPRHAWDGSTRYTEYMCKTVGGKQVIYVQKELAEIFNCDPSTINARIARLGYNHPDVLRPGRGPRLDPTKRKERKEASRQRIKENMMQGNWRSVQCELRHCPITCGLPTTMREASFRTMCAAKQKRKLALTGEYAHPWCRKCKGKTLPKGLAFTQEETIC